MVTPSATLVTATVTANVTTAFDVSWSEPSPPTTGTYSLIFRGASNTGSDDSIFRVATMSDSDSIATGSWEKVGAQATFVAGCEIDIDFSAAALAASLAVKLDSSVLDTDGTLAANSDAKVATQKATKTYADTKLAKTGGALSGDLTVPNIYGDAGQGYLGIYSPSGAGPWLYMDDLFAGLFDASFSQGFYVDVSAGINGVAGNGLASGAWLAAPKFLSVPVTLTKTLLLTTADCGTVLISSAPATGGKVKLPSLSSGGAAAFLLVNYSAYDVTVERQGTNGITLLATGSTTSFTLPSKTAMHLTYYGGAGVYYQIAPEA